MSESDNSQQAAAWRPCVRNRRVAIAGGAMLGLLAGVLALYPAEIQIVAWAAGIPKSANGSGGLVNGANAP